jgi:hypothetical protein
MKMVITLNVPDDTNEAERIGRIETIKLVVAEAVRDNMILDDPFNVSCESVRLLGFFPTTLSDSIIKAARSYYPKELKA